MDNTIVTRQQEIVERNITVTGKIMQFLLENPDIFDALPDQFELVVLPDDDPDIRQHNLDLLDKYGSEGKPVVFARIKAHPENPKARIDPSIFVRLTPLSRPRIDEVKVIDITFPAVVVAVAVAVGMW